MVGEEEDREGNEDNGGDLDESRSLQNVGGGGGDGLHGRLAGEKVVIFAGK